MNPPHTRTTTDRTPVILTHDHEIAITLHTTPNGTVQAWGTVHALSYTAEDTAARSFSVTASRVYDGRLRETMMEIDGWLVDAVPGSERWQALRDVMAMLTALQPIDQPRADYSYQTRPGGGDTAL